MPIEFHCEHCQHVIKAPTDAGGKKGKCPRCQNVVYVPIAPEDSGEIPLSPVDEAEERRAREAERERREVEHRLLRERTMPGEPARGAGRPGEAGRGAAAGRPGATTGRTSGESRTSDVDPRKIVAEFISAMAEGRLDAADRCAAELAQMKSRANAAIDAISSDDIGTGLPKLPRPVLIGFLKQLRARLESL